MFPKELKLTSFANFLNLSNTEAMTERKLTPEQIDELFVFCRRNSVKYYEAQSELVDHIALIIEKKWEQFPDFSFENALEEVRKKFGGRNGLARIGKEREKAFRKSYNQSLLKELILYFKFPKIALTLSLFLFLFEAMKICPNNKLFGFLTSLLMYMISIIFLIYHYAKIYVRGNNLKLLFNRIYIYSSISGISFSSPILLIYIPDGSFMYSGSHLSTHSCLIFAVLTSLMLVSLFADLAVHKKLRSLFNVQFPQFVKS